MPAVLPPPDLEAYLARIGYAGPRAATADVLTAIHAAHAGTIPFENLDILLGRTIATGLPAITRKLVHDRRGGYCFEQNALLGSALRALGFTADPLLGRVRWQVPADVATPLVHQVLLVGTVDAGPRLADVGFGSMSLTRPLRLVEDEEQFSGLEPRRLVRRGPLLAHQARLGETWGDVYTFAPEPVAEVDLELGNWYACAHPQSAFRHQLRASLTLDDRRHTLLNRDLTVRHADGRVERRVIADADELLAVLADYFGLHLPAGTRFALRPDVPWPV
jgi:N-hydroxyarylamine O-acetyltransferase